MENVHFRNLRADELEVRQSSKKDGYVSLLIYKDSRCDQRILDETVGSEDWEVDYKREGDTLLCGISIYSEKHKRFLTKWAAGSESNIEAVKGEQSDAFKRAAFCWGLGRALYTAPKINIPEGQAYGKMSVSEIEYSGDKITHLKIINGSGSVIYNYPGGANTKYSYEPVPRQEEHTAPKTNLDRLTDFCSNEKLNPDTNKDVLLKFYNFYKDKINTFDRTPNIEKLWNNWKSKER